MAILFLLLSCLNLTFAQTQLKPVGLVNDFANLFTPAYKQTLEQDLSKFKSISEISVVTVESLQGDSIENYAQKLFKQWGIGDKQKDNGLLLLISKNDRKVRLEVGYGLEPILPDGLAGEILRNYLTPQFKLNNYDTGVEAAIAQVKTIIQKNQIYSPPPAPKSVNQDNLEFWFFILMILGPYLAAYLARSKNIWAGGLIGAVLGYFIYAITGAIIASILGLVLDFILSKNYDRLKQLGLNTGFRSTYGGFGRSSSGGGFGGFSGGRSGGGGSSSSW